MSFNFSEEIHGNLEVVEKDSFSWLVKLFDFLNHCCNLFNICIISYTAYQQRPSLGVVIFLIHIIYFKQNFQRTSSIVLVFITRETTKLKLHRAVILLSTFGLHTFSVGTFVFPPISLYQWKLILFCSVPCSVSEEYKGPSWHMNCLTEWHLYLPCIYLLLIRKRQGKMQGNTGSGL